MTAEIIYPSFSTTLDVPVERVLQSAMDADLDNVIIIGIDKDGNPYYASSVSDAGQMIIAIEKFKMELLK